MLHMIVNTHDPRDCAFRGPEEEKLLVEAVEAFAKPGALHGMDVRGTWVHRSGHELFLLVDAPDAHAIEGALLEAGLVGRTHSRIVPVVELDDAFVGD